MYDVVIIGGGVSGCSVARELSAYNLKIALLEKHGDVCEETTKANSGIVHSGYDAKPGTMKAQMNIIGNRIMDQVAKELDVPFERKGSFTLCFNVEDLPQLEKLKKQGSENGIKGLEIYTREQLLEIEPSISSQVVAALYAPTCGIICPFTLNIAMAENARENGVEFFMETPVTDILKSDQGYIVKSGNKNFETKVVVNAAGVYADFIHNLVSEDEIKIQARKGQYCLFDKKVGDLVNHTLFQLPTALGKGVLVTPTIHGNLMIGPTAEDIEDKEDVSTDQVGLKTTMEKAALSVDYIPKKQIITSFSGLRAHEINGDFIIGEVKDAPGFYDVAGIESPGLTSAPAIGKYISDQISDKLKASKNLNFNPIRKGIKQVAQMQTEELKKLIEEDAAYGNIICRCETVSEGEILEAVRRSFGKMSMDGLKRRTRTGSGRCQGGFCMPKVMKIMEQATGESMETMTKNDEGTEFLVGTNKDLAQKGENHA